MKVAWETEEEALISFFPLTFLHKMKMKQAPEEQELGSQACQFRIQQPRVLDAWM